MAVPERGFDALYASDVPPPWEIGRPQPALLALVRRSVLADPVLDVGCGTGALALAVARAGHRVIGVDAAPHAISRARERAAGAILEEPGEVSFEVADARRLDRLGLRPRTVLDSGLLHTLDDDGRAAYVAGLEAVCAPGALVAVLAMSVDADLGWGTTADGLRAAFAGPAWSSTAVSDAEITARPAGEELHLPALLLTTRRA
ncbi:class I SAM-dependent methyltransferase [Krasilnikoviella flava]|uniref:Methyltransferase domain-containing protein n=1 Tax=Krasilnikoviella flava TaxID=526729 RepID=A0A1T5KV70_9MICO|nr:class I SAM-dependent methyltransferase [Krasilnikoviella flava]SKC67365.1 Methyltransferase domain-containing protein [Krasilnikoviella flava]